MSDMYLVFAEQVYQWESAIVFFFGIIINVIFWYFSKEKLNKGLCIFFCLTILLGSAALALFVAYIKNKYDYLPEVNYNSYSYASVEQMLLNKGFGIENVNFDGIAEEKLESGEEPASYYFKVTHMTPEPGTFVEKDTKVTLNVTWSNYCENITVKPDGNISNPDEPSITPDVGNTNIFDAKSFYGNVDERYMHTYNMNEISLHISEESMYIYTENTTSSSGFYPENIKLEARLIDYENDKVISTQFTEIGNEIIFEDIPNGIYYYIVLADGYEMYVPYSLLRLEYNELAEKDSLTWGIHLERIECDYSEPFKIQICNKQGVPLGNTEAEIRVVSEDDLSPDCYSVNYVMSDENGYLTICREHNGKEQYESAEFSVKSGCQLQIGLKNSVDYFTVEITDGIGVCTLPN